MNKGLASNQYLVILVIVIVIAAVGWGMFMLQDDEDSVGDNTQDDSELPGEGMTFAYMPYGVSGNPYWSTQRKGFEDAAKEIGAETKAYYAEFKTPEQNDQLETIVNAGYDGAAIVANDWPAQMDVFRQMDDEISIMAINSIPNEVAVGDVSMDEYPTLGYIGQNIYEMIDTSVNGVIERGDLEEGDNVVLLVYETGPSIMRARRQRATEAFEERGINVDMLETTSESDTAESRIRSYIEKNRDLDALMGIGVAGRFAGKVLRDMDRYEPGPEKKVAVSDEPPEELYVGVLDLFPPTPSLMQEGYIHGAVTQKPYMQGYLALKFLFIREKYDMNPPKKIFMDHELWTPENMNERALELADDHYLG